VNATLPAEPWQAMLTEQQRKLLNAAAGDLSKQIDWHGRRLSKDSWRHFLSGTAAGFIMVPAIDMGDGREGFVMLGKSSLTLTKEQATTALTMAFMIGDDPRSQRLTNPPVRWGRAVRLARGIPDNEV